MEQEKVIRLLLRQLTDIQAQADKILSGSKSDESVEGFSRYSGDLKEYVAKNVKNERINSFVAEIPDVNYSRNQVKFWQYLVLPAWCFVLYENIVAKNRTVEEISTVRGKYARLELLIKEVFA
jgi:hypothetical protein